jgi:hypothetical protein
MNDEGKKPGPDPSTADPGMNGAVGEDAHVDPSPDLQLKSLLQHWGAPAAPAQLDHRVMESYRRRVGQHWRRRRIFSTPFSLPVRVMATASLCLLAFALIYLRTERKESSGKPPREALIVETEVRMSRDEAKYITYISQSGFQPVQPVKVQILRRSTPK